jgi:hypothetical protein
MGRSSNPQRSQTHRHLPGSIGLWNRAQVPGYDDLTANLPHGYDVSYSRSSRCVSRIGLVNMQIIALYWDFLYQQKRVRSWVECHEIVAGELRPR